MFTRRSVLLAGSMGLLFAHRPSHGQPSATIRRVGWLGSGSQAANPQLRAAFTLGMQDLGWLEGKNVEYRFVFADDDVNRLDALARELVRQQVDVIMVGNAVATPSLLRATKTIPIVVASVINPVGSGWIASLAKPGGNITGITIQTEEVLGKLVGILHEVAPNARRVAIVLNESGPNHACALGRRPERLRRVGPRRAARCRQRTCGTRCHRRRDRSTAISGRRGSLGQHVL